MYCMKCKTQRTSADAAPVKLKNGRDAQQGTCDACGTKVFKMGKA